MLNSKQHLENVRVIVTFAISASSFASFGGMRLQVFCVIESDLMNPPTKSVAPE